MIIYSKILLNHINNWLILNINKFNKDAFVCVFTGGIDAAITSTLLLNGNNKKVNILFSGYKLDNEKIFEDFLDKNYAKDKYEIIKPKFPEIDFVKFDTRSSMLLAFVDILCKEHNALSVSSINKSEYSLVKFFQKRVDEIFDVYPIIDLYRSECIELAKILNIPNELINNQSATETSFGYTFEELEWLDRQNEVNSIINSIDEPNSSKYWTMYNERRKKMIMAVYKLNKNNTDKSIEDFKKCLIRKTLSGVVS